MGPTVSGERNRLLAGKAAPGTGCARAGGLQGRDRVEVCAGRRRDVDRLRFPVVAMRARAGSAAGVYGELCEATAVSRPFYRGLLYGLAVRGESTFGWKRGGLAGTLGRDASECRVLDSAG